MSVPQYSNDGNPPLAITTSTTPATLAAQEPNAAMTTHGVLQHTTMTAAGNTANDANDVESESEDDSETDSECSLDSYVSNDRADYWESEGALHDHRESSYLPSRESWEYQDQYGRTTYDSYTSPELKSFVKARYLKDPYPQGVTLKYSYLRVLHEADKQWRFRFMDLPTEMRLLVYRELLLFSDPSNETGYVGSVYPAILRISTQINEEAHRMLYDENTFHVAFKATGGEFGNGQGRGSRAHTRHSYGTCPHAIFLRLPKGIDDYPEFFRRIARLEVQVSFQTTAAVELSERATWPLNNFLYTLASFLMDGHRLKKLHLKLDISTAVEDSRYGMILYPLRRLRNIADVTFEGHIPDNIKAKLSSDLKSVEPTFNTLRHWKLIADEAEAQLEALEAMLGESACTCGECSMPDSIDELFFNINHLQSIGLCSCFSSRLEERFLAHLDELRSVLGRVKVNELLELVKTLVGKHKASVKYEAVSDNGRIAEAAKIWAGAGHITDLDYDPDDDWSPNFDGVGVERIEEDVETKNLKPNEAEPDI